MSPNAAGLKIKTILHPGSANDSRRNSGGELPPATVNGIRKPDAKKRPVGASVGAAIGDPTQENQDPDASTTLIPQETHLLAGVDPFGTSWLNDDLLHAFLQAISSQEVCIWRSDVFDENSHDQPKLPDSCRLILTPTDSQLSLRADRDRARQGRPSYIPAVQFEENREMVMDSPEDGEPQKSSNNNRPGCTS
jgi:hypothetical protein